MVVRQSFHHTATGHRVIGLRWKELVETVLLYAGVCATLCLAGAWAGGALDRAPATVKATVTVRAGDTVWSIAKRYGDQHRYILEQVHDIIAINNLKPNRSLQEGQSLVVPMPSGMAAQVKGNQFVCMNSK